MIAIISDIHGNFTALKKVLEKIDSMGISEIFCLGDSVGYYFGGTTTADDDAVKELETTLVKISSPDRGSKPA